mgnify:CR=1 FL=1
MDDAIEVAADVGDLLVGVAGKAGDVDIASAIIDDGEIEIYDND